MNCVNIRTHGAAIKKKTLYLLCFFCQLYDWLAVKLTEMELPRTQTEFDDSLTLKIYLFQFVNYYTSIFYIAFLKGKFVGYPAKYNRIFGWRQEEVSRFIGIRKCRYVTHLPTVAHIM